MLELTQGHDDVVEVVGCPVVNLGGSSVDLSLRAWCADSSTAKAVEYDLLEQIKKNVLFLWKNTIFSPFRLQILLEDWKGS